MILESALLKSIAGVKHGFSTRIGGVSTGPQATLDLGASCTENLRRFRALLGVPQSTRIATASQVHGANVLDARDPPGEGDALISFEPDVAVGVRTADCAPILVAATIDHRTIAVAAIHAGWRGACAGVVEATIKKFPREATLSFAIGPTIGLEAFEVGDEVIEAAQRSLGGDAPPMTRAPNQKAHLDLAGLIEAQLAKLGVPKQRIERTGGCTFENAALFFSHRRDRGVTGRHLSAIAFTTSHG